MNESFLLEKMTELWKKHVKRKDLFLPIKERKIKKDFASNLEQIQNTLKEFKIDLENLFKIYFHYCRDEIDHRKFLRNYKKVLILHYKKTYKKFANVLSLIEEKGIDYVIENLEKLPEDYKKIIKSLTEKEIFIKTENKTEA